MNEKNLMSPVKAIKNHCLDCSGGTPSEVRKCSNTECTLYPFRQGSNPSRKGIGGKRVGSSNVCDRT